MLICRKWREVLRENKRIRNDRIKNELGVALAYPTYREADRLIQKWRVLASCFCPKALRSVGEHVDLVFGKAVISAFQKMHLHVVGRKAFGQLQRQLPRHGRVLLAVDSANRNRNIDGVAQQ